MPSPNITPPGKDVLRKIGVRAVQMISDNVRLGLDSKGNRFSYSTRPFAMPGGKFRNAKGFVEEGRLEAFTTPKGKLWYVVTGGYKDLRSMRGQNPEGDFLQVTGAMMRNLNVTRVTDTSVRIGFDDPAQEKKALWLSVTGAGRSRRLWRFMGLRPEQEHELAEFAGQLVVGSALKII